MAVATATLRRRLVRKAAWTALYAGASALATLVARRASSAIWRKATGEEPPAKN
jgi:hypothetical protein